MWNSQKDTGSNPVLTTSVYQIGGVAFTAPNICGGDFPTFFFVLSFIFNTFVKWKDVKVGNVLYLGQGLNLLLFNRDEFET